MITRRSLLGATAGAGALALLSGTQAHAYASGQVDDVSANGWPIDPTAIATHRVEGSEASVDLRQGPTAAVLLHIARRWHYEIAPVDTGEGGGITGYTTGQIPGVDFESNYLSGTAIALHPAAYPLGGSERLWPHHIAIVRDILLDCDGTVAWGGDLTPAKASHFHLVAPPTGGNLIRVAHRLDPGTRSTSRSQTAGTVADPATPIRQQKARTLPRPR